MASTFLSLLKRTHTPTSPLRSDRESTLIGKLKNDRLFTLLDAVTDYAPLSGEDHTSPPRGNKPKQKMDKTTALVEMLKMALQDPEPDTGNSYAGKQRSPCASNLGSPTQLSSPMGSLHGTQWRTRDVARTRAVMAARVTTQLVSLTQKELLEVQLLCIKILWALSVDNAAAKEIAKGGGLRYLLRLLHEGGSPTNDHRLMSLDALQSFATSNAAQFIAAGGVKVLMNVARFGDRHVQIQTALCIRNLVLQDSDDIIPFGTLVTVQPNMGSSFLPETKRPAEDRAEVKRLEKDAWPGFLAILQSSGIIFEVHTDDYDALGENRGRRAGKVSHSTSDLQTDQDEGEGALVCIRPPEEAWHRFRPQMDGVGVKALWRVEGIGGTDGGDAGKGKMESSSNGFTPSILFVAYRFGFDQGSEKLLLRFVKDAVQVGWRVTVFAISLHSDSLKASNWEELPGVHLTSDFKVFGGHFDLVCIHMCDMTLLNPGVEHIPLKVFIIPLNSTAGIAGLRKPSRLAHVALSAAHDESIQHFGVNVRSRSGLLSMHDGTPPVLQPIGVNVDLIPMPSTNILIDGLRGKFNGIISLHIHIENIRDFPLQVGNSPIIEMVILTLTRKDKEIFRSSMISVGYNFAQGLDEVATCSSNLEGDQDAVVFTVIGLSRLYSASSRRPSTCSTLGRRASTSSSRPDTGTSTQSTWRETTLASAFCTINMLRRRSMQIMKMPHAGETFGKKRGCGEIVVRTTSRWHFESDSPATQPATQASRPSSQQQGRNVDSIGASADVFKKGATRKKAKELLERREKERATFISDGNHYVDELRVMSETVLKTHAEEREALGKLERKRKEDEYRKGQT